MSDETDVPAPAFPTDLVPLPTQPWDERPAELPLDIEECRTALWLTKGNISDAAVYLKVTPMRLRSFVRSSVRLTNEVEEAKEQLKDRAQDVVREALYDDDPTRKDQMARFVLNSIGRDRGWGNGAGGVKINTGGGNVVISWADGKSFGESDPEPNTIEGEVVSESV